MQPHALPVPQLRGAAEHPGPAVLQAAVGPAGNHAGVEAVAALHGRRVGDVAPALQQHHRAPAVTELQRECEPCGPGAHDDDGLGLQAEVAGLPVVQDHVASGAGGVREPLPASRYPIP